MVHEHRVLLLLLAVLSSFSAFHLLHLLHILSLGSPSLGSGLLRLWALSVDVRDHHRIDWLTALALGVRDVEKIWIDDGLRSLTDAR